LTAGSGVIGFKKTEYVYFAGPRPPEVPPGGLVIGGEQIRREEGVKFLGVRIDAGLRWRDHMGKVGTNVQQLLGVLGRIRSVLDERLLVSLYNSMVLPHLQYCLMAWGGFESDRNKAQGETLLKLQKRYVGLNAAKRGLYHADPLFAKYGILKVGNLYRQQPTLYAWKFSNGRLPDSQGAILRRVGESHNYGTRSTRSGLLVATGDHRLVGYRVPVEWGTLTEEQRTMGLVAGFKRSSKGDFLVEYGIFKCREAGCRVCIG
jgi:hypothetical protein